jgi:Xaa-Pro aminopeptidase
VYEAVLEAQYAALQLIKPGAVAAAIDACARELIAARGFAGRFGHALGHGIGMEVHEAPRLGRDSAVTLEEGMVVTVEPGVYIPGWGGVRIEDMVLVERRGCRVLSSARKGIEDSRL